MFNTGLGGVRIIALGELIGIQHRKGRCKNNGSMGADCCSIQKGEV